MEFEPHKIAILDALRGMERQNDTLVIDPSARLSLDVEIRTIDGQPFHVELHRPQGAPAIHVGRGEFHHAAKQWKNVRVKTLESPFRLPIVADRPEDSALWLLWHHGFGVVDGGVLVEVAYTTMHPESAPQRVGRKAAAAAATGADAR